MPQPVLIISFELVEPCLIVKMQCPRDCPFWRGSAGIQHPDLLTSSNYGSENRERVRFCFPEMPVNCDSNCGYGGEAKSIEPRGTPVQVPIALWQHLNHRFLYPSARHLNSAVSGFERFLPSIYVGGRLRTVGEMHSPSFPVTYTGAFPPLWRVQEQATSLSNSTRSRESDSFPAHGSEMEARAVSSETTSPEEQALWRSKEYESVYTPNTSSNVKELTKARALLKPTSCESKTRTTLKSSNHENAWGGPTYTELITEAILSTPEHRMTLSQIYDWITENVEYFRERKNFTSARGWKVGIALMLDLFILSSIFWEIHRFSSIASRTLQTAQLNP